MRHFIAYHNVDKIGAYVSENGFWFSCRRSLAYFDKAAGAKVWVITGETEEGKGEKVYRLVAFFTISNVEPEDNGNTRIIGGDGRHLNPPGELLNPLPWFRAFQKLQGNFMFGFNPVTNIEHIERLLELSNQ